MFDADQLRSKWFLPLFAVALGLVMFVAQWIGGDPRGGLVSLAILAGFGALFLLGGRSETIRGLRGDGRDERFRQIDIHATAVAGLVVIRAIIVAFLVEVARGHTARRTAGSARSPASPTSRPSSSSGCAAERPVLSFFAPTFSYESPGSIPGGAGAASRRDAYGPLRRGAPESRRDTVGGFGLTFLLSRYWPR